MSKFNVNNIPKGVKIAGALVVLAAIVGSICYFGTQPEVISKNDKSTDNTTKTVNAKVDELCSKEWISKYTMTVASKPNSPYIDIGLTMQDGKISNETTKSMELDPRVTEAYSLYKDAKYRSDEATIENAVASADYSSMQHTCPDGTIVVTQAQIDKADSVVSDYNYMGAHGIVLGYDRVTSGIVDGQVVNGGNYNAGQKAWDFGNGAIIAEGCGNLTFSTSSKPVHPNFPQQPEPKEPEQTETLQKKGATVGTKATDNTPTETKSSGGSKTDVKKDSTTVKDTPVFDQPKDTLVPPTVSNNTDNHQGNTNPGDAGL